MACVDARTGERVWKGGRYGHGQVLLVGDVLLVRNGQEMAAFDATVVIMNDMHDPRRRGPFATG